MSVYATYEIAVDWNNNGDFAGAQDAITADVMEFQYSYGRDYASQLTGRCTAGLFTARLKNVSGKYNSFNAASVITGLIKPGLPVRVRMTYISTVTLWQGFLDTIQPEPSVGGAHHATLRAVGSLGYLNQRRVSIAMQTAILTGTAIGNVLTEVGWPLASRTLDGGQTTMTRWFTDGQLLGLGVLRDIEETEAGFLREGKNGFVTFEDRHHRLKSPHTVSQVTYSDGASPVIGYMDVQQQDPLREIYNIIEAAFQKYTTGALAILWTHSEATSSPSSVVSIGPGASLTVWASYPNPASATNARAVDAWTTPVATTDYLANSAADGSGSNLTASVTVVATKFDTAMKLVFTNAHATLTAYLTLLQARGTPITADDPVTVKSEDATSKTAYGERTYTNPAKFLPSSAVAQDWVDFIKSIYKDPIPVLSVTIEGNKDANHMAEVRDRDVSDRITLTATGAADLGINEDFFVERIIHSVRPRRHVMTVELSPATAYAGFWVLDVSKLDTETRLAY